MLQIAFFFAICQRFLVPHSFPTAAYQHKNVLQTLKIPLVSEELTRTLFEVDGMKTGINVNKG